MRTAISMTWEVCNISDLRRLPRKCWYHCEAQKHPVKSVHISLGFWVSRLPFSRIYSWECRQVYAIAIQGHSHNIGSKVIGTGNCINDLRTEQARIGQSGTVVHLCHAVEVHCRRKGRVGAGRILMPTHGLHRGVAHIHCALVPAPSTGSWLPTAWAFRI